MSFESESLNMRVVTLGGGTGNSTVLRGLSPYVGEGLTAVVNTFDDGGATGRLRLAYDDLPAVGDLRQCLTALSTAPADELALFDSRFDPNNAGELQLYGQTLGNLIIARAVQQHGNFSSALGVVSRMYGVLGRVLPASDDNRRLEFLLPDGSIIYGEHNAEESEVADLSGTVIKFDQGETNISEETEAAIEDAELVVLAPGDLYTSLAPVLAVRGMKEALLKSGGVVMISNLMNRSRHTVGFSAVDYAAEYERILGAADGEHVIDRVIYNTGRLDPDALKEQRALGSHPVKASKKMLEQAGYKAVGKDLLSREKVALDSKDALAETRSQIRHHPDSVARAVMAEYFNNGFGRH